MLASITPLGERSRQNKWWLTATAYELGSLGGGAAIGALAGTLGLGVATLASPNLATRLGVAAGACAVALVLDASRVGRRFRGWPRQVDKDWMDRYRGWVYGAGFGFQLGLGVVTILNSAAALAMLALVVMVGSPAAGAVAGGVFGVVRAAPLLAFSNATTFPRLHRAHNFLQRLSAPSRVGTIGVLAGAAVTLAIVASLARS